MEKGKKVIYPMMIELNETIKDILYYVSLPKNVKEKWIELERKSKDFYKESYNLPTVTLKNMLISYLDGVIDMNPASNTSDDIRWLVSFKKVNINVVVNCFKIWVDEFYIRGVMTKDNRRKYGKDESVKKLAEELKELLTPGNFGEVSSEEVVFFQDGHAVNKEAYQLYPLKIVNSLMGQTIMFKGIETKMLYSSKNELVTDTHDFHFKNDYYSFLIKLSVQTLPPENKAYLNVDLSVRRWISRNGKEKGNVYFPTDKNCYIRVKDDRMQRITAEYSKEEQEVSWKSIDFRCFKECQVECTIPKFNEVLKNLIEYNQGNVGDVLIPYQEGINGIDTEIHSGVTFIDRKTVFEFIKKNVYNVDKISSAIEAVNLRKVVNKTNNTFYEGKELLKINSEYFLRQLDKALDGEKLTIEIYGNSKIRDAIDNKLKEYFKNNSKHEIKCIDIENIFDKLEKTSSSKDENLPGFEIRKDEIIKKLKKVNTPTLAIIAIHDKAYFNKLDKKINLDPKKAIRCGFAETGRLTQFITFEEFENQEKLIVERNEKYKKKTIKCIENGKKVRAQNWNDKLNMAVESSILDGFRQLGIVFDYEANKHLRGKKIVGFHVCNYKRTFYGSISPFPIIVTYDVDDSKIMAYCEIIDKVDIPYWKAILGLSKLASIKNISELGRNISNTTAYRRLDRIINKDQSDTVIIIDANGTSRQIIKGISNAEIEKAEKKEFNQVKNLIVNNDRDIDLTLCNKGLSIIRLRHNDEVPSYITMDEKMKNKKFLQASGIFKYENIYYSIDAKLIHEGEVYDKQVSKAIKKSSFSHRNMLEIYPMFVSGDENEQIAVGIADMLRSTSIQFNSQKTVLPLPLHLAVKMEEYI